MTVDERTETCLIEMTGWEGTPEEYGAMIAQGCDVRALPEPFRPEGIYNGVPLKWLFYATKSARNALHTAKSMTRRSMQA